MAKVPDVNDIWFLNQRALMTGHSTMSRELRDVYRTHTWDLGVILVPSGRGSVPSPNLLKRLMGKTFDARIQLLIGKRFDEKPSRPPARVSR
jgi:hypothetical protein